MGASAWTGVSWGLVKHSRLDSLLLAGVGTLAAHELAYVPGSLRASLVGDGVSHAHLPLLWGLGGVVAVAALAQQLVTALRRRAGVRTIDARWLGLGIGLFYVSQEAAEFALAGSPAISLLSQPTLWAGLLVAPVVAIALSRLVNGIVDFVAALPASRAPARGRTPGWQTTSAQPLAAVAWLAHSLSRRGPPVRTAR